MKWSILLAPLLVCGCEKSEPARPAPAIGVRLEKEKNPDEQIRLLKQAQQQFGKQANPK